MNNDELLETVRKCIEKWFSDYGEDVHQYASNLVGRASVGDETADTLCWYAFTQTYYYLLDHPQIVVPKPRAFLCKAVYNRYINSTRGKLRKSTDSLDQIRLRRTTNGDLWTEEVAGKGDDEPEKILLGIEREQELKEALERAITRASLDEDMKRLLYLKLIEEHEYWEIARLCRIPQTVVERRIRVGLDAIRPFIEHMRELEK